MVLRSTSAAPTYFPPAKIKNMAPNIQESKELAEMINLDGGVFANNPTMCAYAEARNTNFKDRNNNEPAASDMYILSIGTGGGSFELKEKEESAKWSLLKWAKTIPDIMMDGSVDTVAFQMNEIHEAVQSNDPGSYMRIDTPTEDQNYAADMSDASPENIKKLVNAANKTLEYAKANGLDDFLDGLIDE
jgi:patatin-like phospholipase/acyl hydrolase